MDELKNVVGYHNVSKEKARELITPHSGKNGNYLLRPSGDTQGAILCTICVTHESKILNYRVNFDRQRRTFFVNQAAQFSSMLDLISHYKQHALNEATGTKLVRPVGREQPPAENGTDDCYVVMEKPDQQPVQVPPSKPRGRSQLKKRPLPTTPGQTTPTQASPHHTLAPRPQPHPQATPTQHQNHTHTNQSHAPQDQQLPGFHPNLIKPLLKEAMQPYLGHSGYYLLRPSSTDALFTLTVSHSGKILNFKISQEGGTFFVTLKNKFGSIQDLIAFHHNSPIRSKQRADQRIVLLQPIPVDPALEAKAKEILKLQQADQEVQAAATLSPGALPPPWQEYYSDQHKRPYYYNTETQVRQWDRPVAPPPQQPKPHPSRSSELTKRIQGRPLPSIPGGPEPAEAIPPTSMLKKRQTMPASQIRPALKKREIPLPALPQKSEEFPPQANGVLPSHSGGGRHVVNMSDRPPAPLPGHNEMDRTPQPLPATPTDRDAPPLPTANRVRRHGSIGAGSRSRAPLPALEETTRPVPPVTRTGSQRELPPLPQMETREAPPLPAKENAPALPPSRPSPQHRSNVPQPGGGRPARQRVVEYEDPPPFKTKKTAPPPLPKKEDRGQLPPQPQKSEESPKRQVPPLPQKEEEPPQTRVQHSRSQFPPLPQKEEEPPQTRVQHSRSQFPPLPQKTEESSPVRFQPPRGPPPLPEKEDQQPPRAQAPPPLPRKEPEVPSFLSKRAVHEPQALPEKQAPPLPPIPSTPQSGGPPAPLPVPPTGGPPPPPPPGAPPPPSPLIPRAKESRSKSEGTVAVDQGGRPFTATDLLAGAQKLKKVDFSPDLRRNTIPEAGGGLEGTLNRAIADKFRNTHYSDSEEEFEDVDDADWDD